MRNLTGAAAETAWAGGGAAQTPGALASGEAPVRFAAPS